MLVYGRGVKWFVARTILVSRRLSDVVGGHWYTRPQTVWRGTDFSPTRFKMFKNPRTLPAAMAAAAASLFARAQAEAGQREDAPVWKFGYGSNISPEFLRTKKMLNPLDSRRAVLHGFSISFPAGRGIDYVEPTFATLKRDPDGEVHGTVTLLSPEDAAALNRQEGSYAVEVHSFTVYGGGKLDAEVYVPQKPLPATHPEGACSRRYRDILANSADAMDLDPSWVAKLRALPAYEPSVETLARRKALPSPSSLPAMSVAELKRHDGHLEPTCYVSACGYIFEHTPIFKVYRGRDITYRSVLHVRGVNLDANDDGGVSPFPRLSELNSGELEYSRQHLDRLIAKSVGGRPVAVLREFWEEQEKDLDGVWHDNAMSKV